MRHCLTLNGISSRFDPRLTSAPSIERPEVGPKQLRHARPVPSLATHFYHSHPKPDYDLVTSRWFALGVRVLSLKKPAEGVQLLRWNKKLPSASTQDPLGLNLRLSARRATQLLYCITSITPRARYYAFFPWAFQDYAENEKGKHGDRGITRGVLSREKALHADANIDR